VSSVARLGVGGLVAVIAASMLAGCSQPANSGKLSPSASESKAPTLLPTTSASAAVTSPPTAPPITTAPIDTGIEVYGNCTTPSVEPPEIVLTCADYGEVLEGLNWVSWTAASATAVGTLVYNDCTPDCAAGHYHGVPGTEVTLTVPVEGAGGQIVWSQVQENPEPPGYATGPFHGGPQPLPIQPD
jgi:hypothetical protein